MTSEQEFDINNALLTLMYEWKIGVIDQSQALIEFKQCLKYYSRMEDVIQFEENKLVDERMVEHYGLEKTIEICKERMLESITKNENFSRCVRFEEIENVHLTTEPTRHFRIKMQAIIQPITPQ